MQDSERRDVSLLPGQEETNDIGFDASVRKVGHRGAGLENEVEPLGGSLHEIDHEQFSRQLIGFWTLLKREIHRFLSIPNQTIVPPFISALLYIAIFGYSIGSRISSIEGVSYMEYIFPGLMMMGIMNSAYMNTSSSLFMSKFQGNIADVLTSPISYVEMVTAIVSGGMVRGIIVGFVIMLTGFVLIGVKMHDPFTVFYFIFFVSTIFSQLGLLTGLWADKWEHLGIFQTYLITPLIYLGGVFYSTSMLPPIWSKISMFNPILYMVNGLRYGMLGVGDTNISVSYIAVFVLSLTLGVFSSYLFKIGYKLRT